jgi:hypothetical protein
VGTSSRASVKIWETSLEFVTNGEEISGNHKPRMLQDGYLYVCPSRRTVFFFRKCKKLINQFCDCLRACRIGFDC